jgi:hypothetical protein
MTTKKRRKCIKKIKQISQEEKQSDRSWSNVFNNEHRSLEQGKKHNNYHNDDPLKSVAPAYSESNYGGFSKKSKSYPPCPPCERCPESSFECKKVPNYNSINDNLLPRPVLSDFSQFGM